MAGLLLEYIIDNRCDNYRKDQTAASSWHYIFQYVASNIELLAAHAILDLVMLIILNDVFDGPSKNKQDNQRSNKNEYKHHTQPPLKLILFSVEIALFKSSVVPAIISKRQIYSVSRLERTTLSAVFAILIFAICKALHEFGDTAVVVFLFAIPFTSQISKNKSRSGCANGNCARDKSLFVSFDKIGELVLDSYLLHFVLFSYLSYTTK